MTCIAASASDASTDMQQAEPDTPPVSAPQRSSGSEIAVQGKGHPEGMAYANFVEAKKAFDEFRQLAPDASLLFAARTHSGQVDGLAIKLVGDSTDQIVEHDEKGQFTLPFDEALIKDEAVLLASWKRGEVGWVPVIRSPGLPDHTERLGDLRLYCRVRSALEKAETPLPTRLMMAARGNCDSSNYRTEALEKPGMRVKLVYQGKEQILADSFLHEAYVSHHTRWVLPLGNRDWPDDTRVEFLEPEPGFVPDKHCEESIEAEQQEKYKHGSAGSFMPWECVWRPQ